jgi:hypothetical protein
MTFSLMSYAMTISLINNKTSGFVLPSKIWHVIILFSVDPLGGRTKVLSDQHKGF